MLLPGEASSTDELKPGQGSHHSSGPSRKSPPYCVMPRAIFTSIPLACTHLSCPIPTPNSFESCWDCPCPRFDSRDPRAKVLNCARDFLALRPSSSEDGGLCRGSTSFVSLLGGFVVSLFAILGDALRPKKRCWAFFGAAPSVALGDALAWPLQRKARITWRLKGRAMIPGSNRAGCSQFPPSAQLLIRARFSPPSPPRSARQAPGS